MRPSVHNVYFLGGVGGGSRQIHHPPRATPRVFFLLTRLHQNVKDARVTCQRTADVLKDTRVRVCFTVVAAASSLLRSRLPPSCLVKTTHPTAAAPASAPMPQTASLWRKKARVSPPTQFLSCVVNANTCSRWNVTGMWFWFEIGCQWCGGVGALVWPQRSAGLLQRRLQGGLLLSQTGPKVVWPAVSRPLSSTSP